MDHDQRFKLLLMEFFREFLELFFPVWAARFDFRHVQWQEQELFPDPPQGEVRRVDLVARLPHRPGATTKDESAKETVALIHVEIGSREAVTELRQQMHEYYEMLRRRHQLPVLPVAVLLRVGLEGIGVDVYTENFDELEVLRFRYLYVGLPGLKAEDYVTGSNWLGVGLAALMKIGPDRKAWLRGEALRRILVECPENDWRKLLLCDCVEAYLQLDEQQQGAFQQMLNTEPYREIVPMMLTTYEKGIMEAKSRGQREAIQLQLEHRFGPLPPEAQQRLDEWPVERLPELLIAVLDARSLEALGLGNGTKGEPDSSGT